MGKNNQHRREPQRPPGRQQIVSGPLVAVEAADAAAFAGQLKDKSKFPFDSPNWIAIEYVHQSLCRLPRYVGYPGLAAEDLEAEVRRPDGVPAMRQCFRYDRNRKLLGPEHELLKPPHWDEHRFFVQSDGRLEVVEGAFRSTAVNIIFAPVKGYAYLVWKPAVAKRWPGVFASTPPSPALTNPIEGKQASPTKVELVNKRIGVQLVHKPTPRAKPQSPSQPTEDQIQALMGDVSKLSDVEKRIRQYVVKKYRDRWKDVEPGRAMTASKDDKLYEEEVGLIHYSISTWRRALGRKPR